MKLDFSQTAEHTLKGLTDGSLSNKLPEAIYKHTGLSYTCTQTEDGYLLSPVFRWLPFRNSFVPEIQISVSQLDGQITLRLTSQPVRSVRNFFVFWFVALMGIAAVLLVGAITSQMAQPSFVFLPVAMGILGYLFFEIVTKITFHFVLRAIRKEFS